MLGRCGLAGYSPSVPSPVRIYTRYHGGRRPRPPRRHVGSWLLGLLCLGLAVLLGWIWWRHTDWRWPGRPLAVKPSVSPLATNPPAPAPAVEPRPAPKPELRPRPATNDTR